MVRHGTSHHSVMRACQSATGGGSPSARVPQLRAAWHCPPPQWAVTTDDRMHRVGALWQTGATRRARPLLRAGPPRAKGPDRPRCPTPTPPSEGNASRVQGLATRTSVSTFVVADDVVSTW